MKHFDESDFYTEAEFLQEDFEKEPRGEARKFIFIAAAAIAIALVLGAALTPLGRAWARSAAAIVGKSFTDVFGVRTSGSVLVLPDANAATSSASGGDLDVAGLSAASGTMSADAFPSILSSHTVKQSAPKAAAKTTKRTSNFSNQSSGAEDGWGDDADSIGTAAEIIVKPKMMTSSLSVAVSKTQPIATALEYPVTISLSGDGRGFVSSTPFGITCDGTGTCLWNFRTGQTVTLRAVHDAVSTFGGWSGGCTGTTATCLIAVHGPVSATAVFHLKQAGVAAAPNMASAPPPVSPPVKAPTATATGDSDDAAVFVPPELSAIATTPAQTAPSPSAGHVLIGIVQTAGDASMNDFVAIVNPTHTSVDMSGWKLRKRSSSGTEYSLKTFPADSTIVSGGKFIWANSADGFADIVNADVASTQILAGDNSVALIDATGAIVDAVAWGNGNGQFVEGSPYPENLAAGQMLTRKSSANSVVDTDNNAEDFEIQTGK